jgi:protein phosphatase
MGTTVTGLALGRQDGHDVVMIFNVGDSRTYRAAGTGFRQVTVDHSLVAEMVRDGEITAEEAFTHPSRNVVTRGLGIDGPLEVDLWTDDPTAGTTYLLCSDGLTDELRDDVLRAVLTAETSPQDKADELVALALEAGGRDNVSVVVATIDGADDIEGEAEDTNPRGVPAVDAADEDTNPREGDR